jgi:hypothetical protein
MPDLLRHALFYSIVGGVLGGLLHLAVSIYRREKQRRAALLTLFLGTLVGGLAGLAGQAIFAWLHHRLGLPAAVCRGVGFAVTGGVIGGGLSGRVPFLPRMAAVLAGVLHAPAAALLFTALIPKLTQAHLAVAGVLGAFIGACISIPRPAEQPRPSVVSALEVAAGAARVAQTVPSPAAARPIDFGLSLPGWYELPPLEGRPPVPVEKIAPAKSGWLARLLRRRTQ